MKKLLSLLLVATFLISSHLKASKLDAQWGKFKIGFYQATTQPLLKEYPDIQWRDDDVIKQGFVVGKHFLYKFSGKKIDYQSAYKQLNVPFAKFLKFIKTCQHYKHKSVTENGQKRYNRHCKQGAKEMAGLLGVSVSVDD